MGCTQYVNIQKGLVSSLTFEHTDLKKHEPRRRGGVPEALEEEEDRQVSLVK